MRFSKNEIRRRLENKVRNKKPILIGSAGLGLVGAVEEMAGVDLIMTCASDYFRMDGRPSAIAYYMFADDNDIVMNTLSRRVIGRVKNTPLIAGIATCDPYRSIECLFDEAERLGYSGIINSPANYSHGAEMEKVVEKTGYHMSFAADADMIKSASDRGLFTIAYVFTKDQAERMADAGADVICPHVGLTVWKLGPDPEGAMTLKEAIAFTGELADAAKRVNPAVFTVCHGGPFHSPQAVQECLSQTGVEGYIGTSAFDGQPIYEAISQSVRDYKRSREIYAAREDKANGEI